MTDDTIKVSDDTKAELDEIKENYYEYTTLSYSEAVDVLIAEYHEETAGGSEVTRTVGGGDSESTEDDEFQGGDDGGMSAEQRAEQFRQ